MKPKTLIILISAVVVLGAIKLLFLLPENKKTAKTGTPSAQVANVTGFIVKPELFENKIFSSGTINASEEVALKPEVSGKLISIFFTEGSQVNKGTLLAKINDADLQAQLKKLNLQLKLSQEREARLKALLEIKGVSQEEYNEAANQLQTIAADIDYTRAQISKTEIRAPFDGKIGLKHFSEGSFVSNTSIIANLEQTEVLKIDFTIPEKHASLINRGDTVIFRLDNQKGDFIAKVFAIEPKINEQTRNISIRAIYDNSKTNIYPGSFARVELVSGKKQSSIMIPTEAVIPELKGKKVFVYNNGKAMPVKVETGTRTEARIEIINGLNEGDTLIATGIMALKPETIVKIIAFKK